VSALPDDLQTLEFFDMELLPLHGSLHWLSTQQPTIAHKSMDAIFLMDTNKNGVSAKIFHSVIIY
jgi:hypothetical protein